MVVAGRFNAPQVARVLARLTDLRIYSSVPGGYWLDEKDLVTIVPHLSMIYSKLSNQLPMRYFDEMSTRLFSAATSICMRDADVIYAFATYGYEAMKKGRENGSTVLLDRACPHVHFQQALLAEEAELLSIPFECNSQSLVERSIKEYELADYIVVPSRYTMRSFTDRGFPESRMKLISLGPNFEPKGLKKGDETTHFTMGVVAGAVLRKGLHYLIEAWTALKLPNATLKLKCPVNELKKSKTLWKIIESTPSIEVVGYMKDLEEFYRSCDLFCLPSVDEGFGMVVLEAIACGCPVLVTQNVGSADIVREGETGFVVNARSADALAERIEQLYGDRARIRRMSSACIDFYKDYRASSSSFEHQFECFVALLGRSNVSNKCVS